jgi:hypothetical protein
MTGDGYLRSGDVVLLSPTQNTSLIHIPRAIGLTMGLELNTMPESVANHDLIEQANSLFWNPLPLDELMADVAPLDPDEHFDIPDLTEEEWQTFVAALEQ